LRIYKCIVRDMAMQGIAWQGHARVERHEHAPERKWTMPPRGNCRQATGQEWGIGDFGDLWNLTLCHGITC
jgi:hypothetical protein